MRTSAPARPVASEIKLGQGHVAHEETLVGEAVEQSGLARILAVDDELRRAGTELELMHTLVNRLREMVGARQVFAARYHGAHRWRIVCVSGASTVEQDAPFIRAIQAFIAAHGKNVDATACCAVPLNATRPSDEALFAVYPFRQAMMVPLMLRSGEKFGSILFLREAAWQPESFELVERQAKVAADIWSAISGRRRLRPKVHARKAVGLVCFLLAMGGLALPVPMTVIAPVEVVPNQPRLVTAPLEGVIEEVLVDPNRSVKQGQTLVRFSNTELRNNYKLAQRAFDVAQSKYRQLLQAAFSDQAARHELGIAKTEMNLRIAERDYARERLDKSVILAATSGLLIYADKNALIGKPVAIGERLMRIAQPDDVAASVSLPVSDAIVLKRNGVARLFLDTEPTRAIAGVVRSESYHAEVDSTGVLAYSVRIDLAEEEGAPRIGSRGTAQLTGDTVSLGFFLFRRPLTWMRQTFGL